MRNNSSDFKPIYIHWYEDDFQADLAVRRMTSRQRAFYRNLLMYAYFGDKRPYLTADDAELWLIADADTQQEWLDNKKPILAKFAERMTKDGPRMVNKRVLEEWQIIEDYLAQRKKAGLASAAARRRENGHSDPEVQALSVHPATTVERPSTSVEHPLTTVEHPSTGCEEAASSLPTNEDEDRDVDRDADGDADGDRDEERDIHQQQQQTVAVAAADSLSPHAQEKETECRKVKTLGGDGLTDGEIIAEYSRALNLYQPVVAPLNTTAAHRKNAIDFFRKYGKTVAIAAWVCFLNNFDLYVEMYEESEFDPGPPQKQYRKWLLNDFIMTGEAEVYAERIRPIIDRGITAYGAIDFVLHNFDASCWELDEVQPELLHTLNNYEEGYRSADRLGRLYLKHLDLTDDEGKLAQFLHWLPLQTEARIAA